MDNQINIIAVNLDGKRICEFYHPDIITRSIKQAIKRKVIPIEIWSEVSPGEETVYIAESEIYEAITKYIQVKGFDASKVSVEEYKEATEEL